VYGQAFGIYALSEFAAASGSEEATSLARRLFGLLETRAHDAEYGGYREAFQRDWAPLAPGTVSYLHLPASLKLLNTHLHLLEAFATYHRLTEDPLARERLVELILIQSNAVVRKDIGVCTNAHQRDWTPLRGRPHDRVSYGHDVENGRLLLEASLALGLRRRRSSILRAPSSRTPSDTDSTIGMAASSRAGPSIVRRMTATRSGGSRRKGC
jgi:mannobiose 2-epimerase